MYIYGAGSSIVLHCEFQTIFFNIVYLGFNSYSSLRFRLCVMVIVSQIRIFLCNDLIFPSCNLYFGFDLKKQIISDNLPFCYIIVGSAKKVPEIFLILIYYYLFVHIMFYCLIPER